MANIVNTVDICYGLIWTGWLQEAVNMGENAVCVIDAPSEFITFKQNWTIRKKFHSLFLPLFPLSAYYSCLFLLFISLVPSFFSYIFSLSFSNLLFYFLPSSIYFLPSSSFPLLPTLTAYTFLTCDCFIRIFSFLRFPQFFISCRVSLFSLLSLLWKYGSRLIRSQCSPVVCVSVISFPPLLLNEWTNRCETWYVHHST
jgi:hypothetical protein